MVFGMVGAVLLLILINGYASVSGSKDGEPLAIQLQHRLPGGWRPNLGALIRCSLENGSSSDLSHEFSKHWRAIVFFPDQCKGNGKFKSVTGSNTTYRRHHQRVPEIKQPEPQERISRRLFRL